MKTSTNYFTTITKIIIALFFLSIHSAQKLHAQNVGIGSTTFTPDANSMLDVQATNKGILIPRMTSAIRTGSVLPTSGSDYGLLVYQTDSLSPTNDRGFWYWNSSRWLNISSGIGWSTLGNKGTSATTNFIGTTDANDFVMRANNTERMRINASTGYVGIGTNSPSQMLSVWQGMNVDQENVNNGNLNNALRFGSGNGVGIASRRLAGANQYGLDFYTNSLNRMCIAYSNGFVGIGTTSPSQMLTIAEGLTIDNNNANAGALTNALIFGSAGSVEGIASRRTSGGNQYGLDFYTGGTNKMCLTWGGNVGIGTTSPSAMLEITNSSTSRGAYIHNTSGSNTSNALKVEHDGTGYGINCEAAGTATTGIYCTQGGVTPYTGIGITLSNGSTPNYTTGRGISAAGTSVGVEGCTQEDGNTTTDQLGGVFYVKNASGNGYAAFACIGSVVDNVAYKIVGNGIVSTIVNDLQGKPVVMAAPEAPEALFQDFGIGQLVNGKVHITLDPILAKNITVDENHPVKIFIQLNDECKGVFVKNKDGNGFDVAELGNGTSNAKFSWMLTATRKNETHDGVTSDYESFRFKRTNNPGFNTPETKEPAQKMIDK